MPDEETPEEAPAEPVPTDFVYDFDEEGQKFVNRATGEVLEPAEPPEGHDDLMPQWLRDQHEGKV